MSPYQENIGQGMILRTVRDERDVEKYAAFHAELFDGKWPITCKYLLDYHPAMTYDDFLLVEDEHTGEVVSTTCLIPWRCRYEDISLDVAMLEMVRTHPGYRRRGLIRAQVNRYHQMLLERRFDLSIINGIPYYYRQYGYAYAIDYKVIVSLPVWRIPDPHNGQQRTYRLRGATLEDVPVLAQLYQESTAPLQFHDLRQPDYWRFLLQWMQYPVRVVQDAHDGHVVGYFCLRELAEDQPMTVVESGITSQDVGMAILQALKAESDHEIQLSLPQTSILMQIARSLGSATMSEYQWLLRIPDIARFLSKNGPVFERRLLASALAGFTGDVCINMFREAVVLRFGAGKLMKVDPIGFVDASVGADGGDLCIPPAAFVRLIFGYRGLDELRDAWPDIVVKAEGRHLIDVLFPRMTSFLYMPWIYRGPITKITADHKTDRSSGLRK